MATPTLLLFYLDWEDQENGVSVLRHTGLITIPIGNARWLVIGVRSGRNSGRCYRGWMHEIHASRMASESERGNSKLELWSRK
jgi:hypothetical protein